jgi:hypothetical protein
MSLALALTLKSEKKKEPSGINAGMLKGSHYLT